MDKNLEKQIDEILTRGVTEVIDKENLKKRLLAGEKLRVKLGIDPTSSNIHLGRAVTLLKLRDLQQLGHQIVFIIGDFTAQIGDTSDKESERPMLSKETVESNLRTYLQQAGKILDMNKVESHRNSEWLGKLTYSEISEQANIFSLAEFSARENIRKRLTAGKRVSLREVLYPLMQGYDSVMIKADVEIGGTDQKFNILAGREMQKHFGQKPQDIILNELIEGIDGRKMSSSWGNTVNITDDPNTMFGKVMSVGDDLIVKYFISCTRVPLDEVEKIKKEMDDEKLNPRDAKLRLAGEIVKLYHGETESRKARQYFINTFSKKEIPAEAPKFVVKGDSIKLAQLILESKNAKSLSDARRKIEQGGVSLDDEKITDVQSVVTKEKDQKVLKIGKMGFVRIKFEK
ncbi:MAG TPA: tyrosine--tRNA ligase [Candidatus Moranbacteria bacterium]|jgi:tyrosyl-tRNA synthetase|nr:tyrosine--tRNA ligase [Candidatus Moranbacteria bacterium]HPX94021.1 tyrosine--tRNA ligase [Candidatus Moranbacteria bacterium]HQB59252.1 tyrosine--tRNA ligase [Candidatus Moranbacteria bacterium]